MFLNGKTLQKYQFPHCFESLCDSNQKLNKLLPFLTGLFWNLYANAREKEEQQHS